MTARFSDAFSQTLTWAATGSTAGGVSNGSGIHQWSLTNAGDTFTIPFVLTNSASSTFNITDIIISGIGARNSSGQGTIFDRTSVPDTSGTANEQTPGSHSGHDLSISSGTLNTYSVLVTYSNVFRVLSSNACTNSGTGSGNQRTTAPCGDEWSTLTIHFNSGTGIGNFTPNSTLSFMQDGDNTVGPLLLGDYNANGSVDAADYVVWRHGEPLQNEVDMPSTVNAADYTAWRARTRQDRSEAHHETTHAESYCGYAFQICRALIAKQLARAFSASASRLVQRLQHCATTRSRSIDFAIEPM